MTTPDQLEQARRSGRKLILAVVAFYGVVAIAAAFAAGNAVLPVTATAALIALSSACARGIWGRFLDEGLALSLIAQTALITAAFAGHPWQMDSHMIYFASLAMTILLIKPHLLLVAAAAIALHHLALSFVMPALVYPSANLADALSRSIFHAAVVGIETAVLAWSVQRRITMGQTAHEDHEKLRIANTKAERLTTQANTAHAESITAQNLAEHEAKRAQDALRQAHENAEKTKAADAAMRATQQRHDAQTEAARQALSTVVKGLSDALSALAAKRLDQHLATPFPDAYESIRADYNAAVTALTETISSVAVQIETLRGNAKAIADTTQEQSKMSETRAETLHHIATSLRELTVSVGGVAQNASDASDTVTTSKSHAEQAAQVLGRASEAMQQIRHSAASIGSIVSLIEDIAFQTNLLSLNAGVEAARAGEAGRGFAVVATEVRALAARSSKSASEIKTLISRSDHHVETGVALVTQSGDALTQILELIARTDNEMQGITTGVHNQNSRLETLTKSLDTLSAATKKDVAIIENTARATANMDRVSDGLAQTISVFDYSTAPTQKPPNILPSHAA